MTESPRGFPPVPSEPLAGFEPRVEREDINVSPTHPLSELAVLLAGVVGVTVVVFVALVVAIDLAVPLVPPAVEQRVFAGWGDHLADAMSTPDRQRVEPVEAELGRLLQTWPECPFPIRIGLLDSREVNAVALPGGTIVVTSGLLDAVEDEREVAFVLAHELGHFAARDHLRSLGRGAVLGLLAAALGAGGTPRPVVELVGHLDEAASRGMDRRQETAADRFALELVVATYGDAAGAAAFLDRLSGSGVGDRDDWLPYLATHPSPASRAEAVRSLAESEGWRLNGHPGPEPDR